MLKKDAIAYFGSQGKVARALKITRQAVQAWPKLVPWDRAFELERLTQGELPAVKESRKGARSLGGLAGSGP